VENDASAADLNDGPLDGADEAGENPTTP